MLSSMYVQVAVAADNEPLKRRLKWLTRKIVSPDTPASGTGELVKCIAEIYEKYRSRRFEKTVLPFMMNTGKISGMVFDEIGACRNGISELYFVLTCFPWKQGIDDVSVKHKIALYTGLIEELIDKKEGSLFEQAKTVLSDENWFEMAESIMEEDIVSFESDENGCRFQANAEWTYPGNRLCHFAETE